MSKKLAEIDTKAITSLLKLKKEKDRINGLLEKAEALKDKTDSAVFERVKGDYEKREAELDSEAAPLKDEARAQYGILATMREQMVRACERARVDKEEIEFRHAVGELNKTDFETKLKEAEKLWKERDAELAEADKLKERFISAFESEEELETKTATSPPVPSPGTVPVPTTPQATPTASIVKVPDPQASPDATAVPSSVHASEAAPPVELPDDSNETMYASGAPVAPPPPTDPDGTRIVERPNLDAADPSVETFIVPRAKLVSVDDRGQDVEELPLGAFNYIGRSEESQVRLGGPGVSRKHALVTIGPEGFSIKDLKSQNGTYVNGERVTERLISNGDFIAIGSVRLQFRVGD
jgi:anti-sigma factor RsiW